MIEALSEFGWSQWPWNLPSCFSGVQGEGWPEELHPWVQAWAWWEYHRHHGEERGLNCRIIVKLCKAVAVECVMHRCCTSWGGRSRCLLLGLQDHTGKAIWNLRRLGPLFTVCITSSIRKSATLHLTKKSRAAGNNPSGVDAQSHGPRRWDGIFGFGWPNQKELVCWSRQHDFWSEDEGEWWRCCNHRHHQEASDYHLIQVMISVYSLAPVVLKVSCFHVRSRIAWKKPEVNQSGKAEQPSDRLTLVSLSRAPGDADSYESQVVGGTGTQAGPEASESFVGCEIFVWKDAGQKFNMQCL